MLFTVATGGALDRSDRASIFVQSLATQESTVIVQGGSDGRYLPTGPLVYIVVVQSWTEELKRRAPDPRPT